MMGVKSNMRTLFGCLGSLLIMALVAAVSYFIVCGLYYLIALCFAWEFSWLIATGIWLLLTPLYWIFGR